MGQVNKQEVMPKTKLVLPVLVGNKAKGRISKRVFQEKARQIFRKRNISYPQIRTRTCFEYWFALGKFSVNTFFSGWWHEPLCKIWYHCYSFKNVKNTHQEVLLLEASNFTKKHSPMGVFHVFKNVHVPNRVKHHI